MSLLLLLVTLATHPISTTGTVTFASELLVAKGEVFEVPCRIDSGLIYGIYSPSEIVPTGIELEQTRDDLEGTEWWQSKEEAGGNFLSRPVGLPNGATEQDHGFYWCVAFRKTGSHKVEVSIMNVVILDLCADVTCPRPKTCVPNLEEETHECQCLYEYDHCFLLDTEEVCTDTCESFRNTCEMDTYSCKDGVERNVLKEGLCPTIVQPEVKFGMEDLKTIEVQTYEAFTVDSGITQDGVPAGAAEVTWILNGMEMSEVKNQLRFSFSFPTESENIIECNIVHCGNFEEFIVHRYKIIVSSKPHTFHPACTVFPGGVIQSFDFATSYYDLACSHVLAADFFPEGDYTQAWFIYGKFDQHDDDTALMAMTIYVGSTAFEFQRGWIVNLGGRKFEVEEGVPRTLGDCTLTFTGLHLRAACPYFYAYYDGLMSGHIRLGNSQTPKSTESPPKRATNIGLCWDNHSGFRSNWQVGSAVKVECNVDVERQPCFSLDSSVSQDGQVECENHMSHLLEEGNGEGPYASCVQLRCDEKVPTPAQDCALNQAESVNRVLASSIELSETVDVEGCPEDECEWKLDLVGRGCFQLKPPFEC